MSSRTTGGGTLVKQKSIAAWVQWFFEGFLYGDAGWARIRISLVVLTVDIVATVFAILFEPITLTRVWHNLVFPSLLLVGSLWICLLMARDIFETNRSKSKFRLMVVGLIAFIGVSLWLESEFLKIVGMTGPFIGHYLLAPLAVLVITTMAVSGYIQNIYHIDSHGLALLYLLSSFCGIAYPKLTISNGQRQIDIDKISRLDLIGGPGYITIDPSNAALIEEQSNYSRALSGGTFFVSRFGYLTSIVYLGDQRGHVPSVSAITRDGITVTVREIELRFRIWSPSQGDNNTQGQFSNIVPYPHTAQAVRASIYNQAVDDRGLTSWSETVKNIVVGRITGYISERKLDQIVTPNYEQSEPRDQIRKLLFATETQNKLRDVGAQLLWCDIGHFEEDSAAMAQRLETWSAKWTGNANVIRAQGEAQRMAYQELGRAEGQADLLMSIIHALDDIDLSKEKKDQNIRNVILMRTAQVLESLAETSKPISNKSTPPSD
jgi:hypothetical protein